MGKANKTEQAKWKRLMENQRDLECEILDLKSQQAQQQQQISSLEFEVFQAAKEGYMPKGKWPRAPRRKAKT